MFKISKVHRKTLLIFRSGVGGGRGGYGVAPLFQAQVCPHVSLHLLF